MITRDNFEMFCMQYADGELSPAEILAFDTFLKNNPDLLAEWEQWQQLKLQEDATVFPNKASLLHPIPAILSEEQAWLYIDGEQSLADRISLEERLQGDTAGNHLIHELRNLVLEPAAINCPDKELLYQIPRKRRVIAMRFAVSAAAALLLIVLCWPLFTNKPFQPTINSEDVVKESSNPSIRLDTEKPITRSPIIQPSAAAEAGKLVAIAVRTIAEKEMPATNTQPEKIPAANVTSTTHENVFAVTEKVVPPIENNQSISNTTNSSLSQNATENTVPESANLAQPVIYQELNTESERETITIGLIEMREGRFRGIIRKAGALLKRTGPRPENTTPYKIVPTVQPL